MTNPPNRPNKALERTATRFASPFAWLKPLRFERHSLPVAVAQLGLVSVSGQIFASEIGH